METTAVRLAFTVAALSLGVAGCDESVLKGLEGRWRGTIVCYSGEAELTAHFTLEGDTLVGTAQTRFKDNNKAWDAKAHAATSCQEDTCTSDQDCPLGFDNGDALAGELRRCEVNPKCASRCKTGDAATQGCDPCEGCKPCQLCARCNTGWLPLILNLSDENVLVPDPELKLWRVGGEFLKGSVVDYCADPLSLHPVVELHKD